VNWYPKKVSKKVSKTDLYERCLEHVIWKNINTGPTHRVDDTLTAKVPLKRVRLIFNIWKISRKTGSMILACCTGSLKTSPSQICCGSTLPCAGDALRLFPDESILQAWRI